MFPKMGNTKVRNHNDLLSEYKAKYGQTAINYPYSTTNPVTDFKLAETGYFVRVFSVRNKKSNWIFRIEDLRQYGSVDEIVEKLTLLSKPSKIGLVELPEGVKLRKSYSGSQNWSNGTTPQGGGIQYEIIGKIQGKWFEPLFDNINNFLIMYIDLISLREFRANGQKVRLPGKLVRYIEFDKIVVILLKEEDEDIRVVGIKFSQEGGINHHLISWEFQIIDGLGEIHEIVTMCRDKFNDKEVIYCRGSGFDIDYYLDPYTGKVLHSEHTR